MFILYDNIKDTWSTPNDYPNLANNETHVIVNWSLMNQLLWNLNKHITSCVKKMQFHQPRLVIRTFHRQGRCSRGGIFAMNIVKKSTHAVINKIRPLTFSYVFVSINDMNAYWYWWDWGGVYDFFATIKEIWSQNFSIKVIGLPSCFSGCRYELTFHKVSTSDKPQPGLM